ncbi:MAG: hypothetical protein ACTSUC_09760 [Promethearchaeota archaeon]
MVKFTDKAFEDFCEALNHRMTRMEVSMGWIKKILGWQTSFIGAILATLLAIIIKIAYN